MNFVCDTNIISEMMKRAPHPEVEQWFNAQTSIRLSVITVEEIYCGLAYKKAIRQLEWFQKFLKLRGKTSPITKEIAHQCGLWRGEFRRQGIIRTQADLLIAATAKVHNLVLATRNTCDFEGCGLQLFNPFLEKQPSL
jgi:predicted nucleic acid-binding protein